MRHQILGILDRQGCGADGDPHDNTPAPPPPDFEIIALSGECQAQFSASMCPVDCLAVQQFEESSQAKSCQVNKQHFLRNI